MIYGTIKADDMPHPACLVDYGEHGVMAAMFHYSTDEEDPAMTAGENGFDIMFSELPEGDPLLVDPQVLAKWRPDPPQGWILGGVSLTDDGPVAIFLRALEAEDDQQEAVA